MNTTVHIIGKRFEEGKIGRFSSEFTDEQFDLLLNEIGGTLPQGFLAWHIALSELEKGSKRLERLKRYPVVTKFHPFADGGSTYANPLEELLSAKRREEDDAKWREEESLYLYNRSNVMEAVKAYLENTNKQWDQFSVDIAVYSVRTDLRLKLPVEDPEEKLLRNVIQETVSHLEEKWSEEIYTHSQQP